MTESQLQDAFEAWLRKRRIPFIRSRMDQKPTIRAGWPDFSVFYCGHCLFIETKVGKNKPTTVQAKVIAELRTSGNKVVIAYSLEACIEATHNILCDGKDLSGGVEHRSGAAGNGRHASATNPVVRQRGREGDARSEMHTGNRACNVTAAASGSSAPPAQNLYEGYRPQGSSELPDAIPPLKSAIVEKGLFIGQLSGTSYVFFGHNTPGGECQMVRKATAEDLIHIPKA